MKMFSKITISLATVAVVFVGCVDTSAPSKNENVTPTVNEQELSYRNTSLYHENDTQTPVVKYSDAPAGASQKIARAYQDAPPMIPHDTEGMLPIQKDMNMCIDCHMPEVAESMGATPIPPSHFLNMRPHNKIVNGTFEKEVDNLKNEVSVKKSAELYQGRFNCTQCHAPQSNAKLITENKFQADFLSEDGAFKSHWDEVVTESLDTVGKDSSVTSKDIANENSKAGTSLMGGHH